MSCSKETAVLMHFFQDKRRDSKCSGLLKCQGGFLNQSETMRFSRLEGRLGVLDFSHVRVVYVSDQKQWKLQRRRQERQRRPNAICQVLDLSMYMVQPIRNNVDFVTLEKVLQDWCLLLKNIHWQYLFFFSSVFDIPLHSSLLLIG